MREQAAAIGLVTQPSQEPDWMESTYPRADLTLRLSLGTDCNFSRIMDERASSPSVALSCVSVCCE